MATSSGTPNSNATSNVPDTCSNGNTFPNSDSGLLRRILRPRFSLTTLFVIIAVFACIFAVYPHVSGWLAHQITPHNAFRVEDVNGRRSVSYSANYPPKHSLRDLALIQDVDSFSMNGFLKADDLQYIAGWKQLESLNISGNPIGDEGLKYLQGFVALKKLYLQRTGIKGPGLRHLRQMQSLERLSVIDNPISDPDEVKHIAALTNLRHLSLSGTQVTSECLKGLVPLRNLQRLDLHGTPIDDTVVECLIQLPSLQWCNVDRTNVTVTGRDRLAHAGIDCYSLEGFIHE